MFSIDWYVPSKSRKFHLLVWNFYDKFARFITLRFIL